MAKSAPMVLPRVASRPSCIILESHTMSALHLGLGFTDRSISRNIRRSAYLALHASILCLLVGLIFGRTASGQTGGQGAIQGTVTDPTGAVVSNATVTATDQASGV